MLRGVLVLLLLVAWSQVDAATHVNISIAQQAATNPADVKYVDGMAPAELRAGPQRDEDQQFQRIQERQQQVLAQSQSQPQQQQQQQVSQTQQQQQQPQQLTPRQGLGLQPPAQGQPPMSKNGRLPRRRNHSRRPAIHQQPPHSGQFRQRNQQLRQNQEFERYIQSYHSHGPTVETVYESSNPSPQRYTQTSSGVSSSSSVDDAAPQKLVTIGGHRSQQLRMFERQVAAPVSTQGQSANVEAAQDSKPIYEPQPAPIQTANIAPPVSSSSSSASSSSSSAPASSQPAPAAPALPSDSASGYDSATSYNRPSYDPNGFSYEDGQDVEYQDQYPPEVDDGQGYEDYADQSGYQGGSGYLPPAPPRSYAPPQRPLVTKTIQIVQPALKAKKYEVRHPAIQKEFYDIEERVVIKPAGTLVVELEHPVAKIPKGETLLPLGHPHPAVASAYSNSNTGQIQSQTYNNNVPEYRPSYDAAPAAKDQQTTTIGSSVTTMPSYDQQPKDDFVESRLQQQQPLGDVTDGGKSSPSFISGVDASGNAVKINAKHLSPKMIQRAEPEQDYSRSGQRVYQQRNNFNRQPYNQDDDYFSGEYLPNVSAGSVEAKPARLELAEEKEDERPTQIIKHEHKIHLPPSQHNIYLGRTSQTPLKERRIQEVPAQVAEIKPYLRSHVGPTVLYAKSQTPRTYYNQPSRQRVAEELDYSAPYSQMRFSPDNHSSRLVQSPQVRYSAESQSSRLEEAPKREEQEPKKEQQNTHIQIQIASDQEQSAVVATTIAPDCDRGQQRAELRQQKSQRLVDAPSSEVSATQATPSQSKAQPDVDVSLNGAAGHLKPNERVIAATAAPTDASATSETFHKRRIVVNHPFQTVREVVEHEPFTNYHQIQVNEPAPPSHYHQAYYQPPLQTHGSLVHYQTSSAHGNLYG
ncbi:mediator of RNA polymerase II transcription subunit 15 [Drosophila teissieri]|uniref:mediator of RNA polymerase II transcription subunit 15 n=1 Tax=Drosophila teissieri TaxID=7243 RepID=UPI001CBA2B80|nr:mediator of RNA polymerase II transcription subunit 15 [Drosophila teissieri]